ncbi:MAG: HNH endonuclease [Clostridiales bacterium]|nr:HNH endonuclease [Clostridiales bacterium]
MQIPQSEKVNTSSLARLFDNKSESYKLFWFKAILHEVSRGRNEIPFRELIERMIIDAWYMVSEYKLNLGPADTLEKTVLYIADKEDFLPTEKENVLLDYLRSSEDRQLQGFMRTLSLNVPYRLQAPFMQTPDSKIWYKQAAITDYINAQKGMMYTIEYDGPLNSRIIITPVWMDYLRSNLGIIMGWTDYNLILYLQRRNPTVPGISNKINPPQERKLTAVNGYWKYMIQHQPVIDIYTGDLLAVKGISIDHFVPWSYIASDELWNLIPTIKSVNSSKSNNLPDWKVYFDRLAKTEYDAYLLVEQDAKAKQLFEKCSRENLNSEEIRFRLYRSGQTREHFTGQLEEILLPIYESAKNMGFREWVYRSE